MIKKYIKEKYNKPGNVYLGLVHRLDRPVGGIMVFARSSKAASRLCKLFQEHQVTKKYLAIVNGKLSKDTDEWVDYIEKGNDGNSFISNNGKKAVLEYQVLEYNSSYDCSLVSILLKSGRHHQIRVQFSSRGHYLLGDQRYGVLDRQPISLFAYYLSFVHPVTKEEMSFELYPAKIGYWTRFTL
jgi:23S rRNA pseudouridine1911/1915/1917 synthase